jgi:RecB family endonuclease NucS
MYIEASKGYWRTFVLNSKHFTVLLNPSFDEAEKALKEAVSQRKTILVVGDCWVHYQGRASSKLEPGERILMIKKDGSLLVHRSVGYEPVNWQPPGCIFHVEATDNELKIHAVRRKPAESVKVFFDKICMVSALSLADSGEFSLYASEKNMQEAILIEPSLVEEGFKPVSHEERVEPGFVDVYGVDKDANIVVVEIKRRTAGSEAVLQLARYVDSIGSKVNRKVRGILVAPSISKGVQRLLTTLELEFKALDPKKCASVLEKPKIRRLETFFKKEKRSPSF